MNRSLTRTELDWCVMALNHDIAAMQAEIDASQDDAVASIAKIAIDGRETLRTKLLDIIMNGQKTVAIR